MVSEKAISVDALEYEIGLASRSIAIKNISIGVSLVPIGGMVYKELSLSRAGRSALWNSLGMNFKTKW